MADSTATNNLDMNWWQYLFSNTRRVNKEWDAKREKYGKFMRQQDYKKRMLEAQTQYKKEQDALKEKHYKTNDSISNQTFLGGDPAFSAAEQELNAKYKDTVKAIKEQTLGHKWNEYAAGYGSTYGGKDDKGNYKGDIDTSKAYQYSKENEYAQMYQDADKENDSSNDDNGSDKSTSSNSNKGGSSTFGDDMKAAGYDLTSTMARYFNAKNGGSKDPYSRDEHLENQAREHLRESSFHDKAAQANNQVANGNWKTRAEDIARSNDQSKNDQRVKDAPGQNQAILNREYSNADYNTQMQRADSQRQEGVKNKEKAFDDLQVAEQEKAGADVYKGLERDRGFYNSMARYLSSGGRPDQNSSEPQVTQETEPQVTQETEPQVTQETEPQETEPQENDIEAGKWTALELQTACNLASLNDPKAKVPTTKAGTDALTKRRLVGYKDRDGQTYTPDDSGLNALYERIQPLVNFIKQGGSANTQNDNFNKVHDILANIRGGDIVPNKNTQVLTSKDNGGNTVGSQEIGIDVQR